MSSNAIKVAVAVITDAEERILITQRSMDKAYGGFWEFPGGKLEKDEEASLALAREIKEEVGLDVVRYTYLGEVNYLYKEQPISLLIYHIYDYQGKAQCYEAQTDLRWAAIDELHHFQFPPANVEIINLIKENLFSQVTER